MLGGADGHLVYEWGMGTDDFLHEGKGLELFATDAFSDGSAGKVWIGGTYGTDVASVDLVATDGTTVPATVRLGDPGAREHHVLGSVDGDLAMAVTARRRRQRAREARAQALLDAGRVRGALTRLLQVACM